jgi:pilus assembly protein FimV
MLRQKPLVVSLVLAGLVASIQVNALGLDRLNVTTALGQPLVAEVDISVAAGDDVDSIRANIASPAVYRAAGVEYQGILQTIRVQVLRRANGQPYLRLASNQSVNDPYLDILVELNSSTGRLVREYVFLLDPPASAVAQAIEPATPSRPTLPAQSSSTQTARPTPVTQDAPMRPQANNSGVSGGYSVKPGDTLSGIAGRNAQPGVSIEQLMIAIQRNNPDAFIGGNINRLRANATLNLPSSGEAQSIAQNTAASEVRVQAASWRGYVARAGDNVPNVASDQPSARASGRVTGAVADTGGGAVNADKLKLSRGERNVQAGTESKVAATKALKEEQSRAAQLEKTKQDLEKALAHRRLWWQRLSRPRPSWHLRLRLLRLRPHLLLHRHPRLHRLQRLRLSLHHHRRSLRLRHPLRLRHRLHLWRPPQSLHRWPKPLHLHYRLLPWRLKPVCSTFWATTRGR